jgi:hypothetical protein
MFSAAATMKEGATCMTIVIADLKAVRWRTLRHGLLAAGMRKNDEPHTFIGQKQTW